MKKKSARNIGYVLLITAPFLLLYGGELCADIAQGGSNELAVASAIHSVGGMETLYAQFTETMNSYDLQRARCGEIKDPKEREKCEALAMELLEKGKDILAKLLEQAANIEAEIAMNKKKVGQRLSQKLDRLLIKVMTMRQEASKKMAASAI